MLVGNRTVFWVLAVNGTPARIVVSQYGAIGEMVTPRENLARMRCDTRGFLTVCVHERPPGVRAVVGRSGPRVRAAASVGAKIANLE